MLKYQGEIFGLVSGFLMAGIKDYIGTFTYVNDKTSVDFAIEFYKNLINKEETVGSSIRQARKLIGEKYGLFLLKFYFSDWESSSALPLVQ